MSVIHIVIHTDCPQVEIKVVDISQANVDLNHCPQDYVYNPNITSKTYDSLKDLMAAGVSTPIVAEVMCIELSGGGHVCQVTNHDSYPKRHMNCDPW